jgi:hypothetical protein
VLTAKIAGVTHCIIVAFSEALLKSGMAALLRAGRFADEIMQQQNT